ncbi:phosphate/phosphite/phosphonate ABC transporter substrate-binding protein [Dokdonella sp.]|uniref:phosphate/phosphite/phosphonate ABC transporter substrate-binding protein n=1 Tax=Dokdonella sp. TaxID=2291710 RepID=UPI0035271A17
MKGTIARLIFVLACLGPGLGAGVAVHAEEAPGVLVLGRISDDPKSHYESMKVLLDYVVAHMADVGIREGKVLMARDALQMASYLRRGRVDWVSETAGGAMLLQRRAGAETFLLSDRNGVRRYHTVYFARRDGKVTSIEGLRGHRIAFQNPTSTSAYFIPAMELLERDMNLEILGSPFDPPVPDSVGYVFARTERNIATWVHKNLVDVGTVSNLDWTNARKIPEFFKSDFIVLRESPEVPRGVEVVRQSLKPEVRARLREVLIGMADDPEAIGLLEKYHQSMRFFDLDETDRKDLERLRVGVNKVSAGIE